MILTRYAGRNVEINSSIFNESRFDKRIGKCINYFVAPNIESGYFLRPNIRNLRIFLTIKTACPKCKKNIHCQVFSRISTIFYKKRNLKAFVIPLTLSLKITEF